MVLGKQSRNHVDASKVAVGEIDTSSPFESVKHAVSLFGAVAFTRKRTQLSGRKPRTHPSEKLSAKESRLHLAEKELNKLKENLRSTDVTRSLALAELEKAKKTIEILNKELLVFSKSKDAVRRETETSDTVREKSSSNIFDRTLSSCRREVDTLTAQYLTAALKLNEAKKELGNLRQDYDSALRSFNAGLRQSSEAEAASKANIEAAVELSEKISVAKKLIQRVKLASEQAVEEKLRIEANREMLRHEYRMKLDGSDKTREMLKKELDPDTARTQKQLESTYDQNKALKQDIHKAKNACTELAVMLALELDTEKAFLQELLDEENSLRQLVESLKLELENMKKELFEMSEKEVKARQIADDLETELQTNTLQLEKYMSEESKASNTFDEMKATLVELTTEIQCAIQESVDVLLEIEEVVIKADADRNLVKEYEAKLQLLLREVKAARSAEAEVLKRVKLLSERKDSGAKITLSNKEFNSLRFKINDSAKLADTKVSVAMVQAEVAKAFQNDSLEILGACQKELAEVKLATAEALKLASEAEADKMKLEVELERLDQSLLNKAEGISNSNTYYETKELPMSYPKEISKSHSTSSARRRRMTLGEFLKMDWEGKENGKRGHMRSLSGLFRGM